MSVDSNSSIASQRELAAWRSLVNRSFAAWEDIFPTDDPDRDDLSSRTLLGQWNNLDEFLAQDGTPSMFWFFQLRKAFELQDRFRKWSRKNLSNYILLPACPGYVYRRDCFFVSHFWQTKDDPDPNGEILRMHQQELSWQTWKYIWVDWTCMPQDPRSGLEEAYFLRCLQTMSGIIRNCGFMYFYPPFEPRLWILYEIAEFVLTCNELNDYITPDIKTFRRHIDEMAKTSVQAVLRKYKYRCGFERDERFLTSWLELLILLKKLCFHVEFIRNIMDSLTWFPATRVFKFITSDSHILLEKLTGILVIEGEVHEFTRFPRWNEGKYSSRSSGRGDELSRGEDLTS